jgi:hypothetical protein
VDCTIWPAPCNWAVGIHLLDFDLFTASEAQRNQATWRFEMRDERQPEVSLGNSLQLNLIELKKADQLGSCQGPLAAWVMFFEHWREELKMATIAHEPVLQAMNRIRRLSADEEAQRLAFVRERALRDEVSLLNDARQEEAKRILQRTSVSAPCLPGQSETASPEQPGRIPQGSAS